MPAVSSIYIPYELGFELGLIKQAATPAGGFLGGLKQFWSGMTPQAQRALIGGGVGVLGGGLLGRGPGAMLGGLAGAGLGYYGQQLLPQLFGQQQPAPQAQTPAAQQSTVQQPVARSWAGMHLAPAEISHMEQLQQNVAAARAKEEALGPPPAEGQVDAAALSQYLQAGLRPGARDAPQPAERRTGPTSVHQRGTPAERAQQHIRGQLQPLKPEPIPQQRMSASADASAAERALEEAQAAKPPMQRLEDAERTGRITTFEPTREGDYPEQELGPGQPVVRAGQGAIMHSPRLGKNVFTHPTFGIFSAGDVTDAVGPGGVPSATEYRPDDTVILDEFILSYSSTEHEDTEYGYRLFAVQRPGLQQPIARYYKAIRVPGEEEGVKSVITGLYQVDALGPNTNAPKGKYFTHMDTTSDIPVPITTRWWNPLWWTSTGLMTAITTPKSIINPKPENAVDYPPIVPYFRNRSTWEEGIHRSGGSLYRALFPMSSSAQAAKNRITLLREQLEQRRLGRPAGP